MDLVWGIYDIPTPEKEFKFHPVRRWRFDYAWISRKVAVEIDGGIWTRGRHSRGAGMLQDNEKLNEAQRLDWKVFRFTPQQLKKGEAQEYMRSILCNP